MSMYDPDQPDSPFNQPRLATDAEAVSEYADNAGMDHPDQAWLLTSYDTWVANPHYSGPRVPHPEADEYADELAAMDAGFSTSPCPPIRMTDDEIPF